MAMDRLEAKKMLEELNAPQLFDEIQLLIDDPVCVRSQGCRLCVDKCPTKALYMGNKVEFIQDLCNGCGGCVRVCMVPGCITLTRRRKSTGRLENFSTPLDTQKIDAAENARKKYALILKRPLGET
ncbi:MAG: ATP-binding protein [Candidatus Hodarchaeales archaeon]|jgi:Na+-translocating ferredoxin:NAD+ oxidoreductase RNF subunit RnfB